MQKLNCKQVATMLDLGVSSINSLCRKGILQATKGNNGRWSIERQSVVEYQEHRKTSNRINKANFQRKFNEYIDQRMVSISADNTKLGDIPSFNLMPLLSCPGSTPLCRQYCYARQSLLYCLQSKRAWSCNLYMVKNHIDMVEKAINDWIAKEKPVLFRIHSAGDYVNQEYVNMWFRIARKNKDTRFLSFTKVFDLDYSDQPENLVIMVSVFPDTQWDKIPAGYHKSFAVFPKENHADKQYDKAIESIIFDQRQTLPCPGSCEDCGLCWHIDDIKKNVVFRIHGWVRERH